MELKRKRAGQSGSTTAIAGLVLVACAPCCIPLVAPLMAWLGVASLALPSAAGAVAITLGIIAIGLAMLRRRRQKCQPDGNIAKSRCQTGCPTTGTMAPNGDTGAATPAPVACTLSAEDFKARTRWLKELRDRALLHHHIDGLGVHLSYRLDAANDVEQMVRQEQACCAFLQFDLYRTSTTLQLTVSAPADAADDARVLFAHLIPD